MNANRLDNVPFLYFIVFSNDYTSYQIYDASVKPVESNSERIDPMCDEFLAGSAFLQRSDAKGIPLM
jgi:hypothetical protein